MRLRDYRHVVWDWNGTLFDDAWLCVEVMNGLLRPRGLPPLDAGRYQALFRFPVIDYYHALGFDLARESFEKVGTEFMAEYERRRHACGLAPGAREMLARLRDAGLSQSVLSAYRHDTLEELLRHHGIRAFFDHVTGGDDHYAHGKTGPALAWMKRAGLRPPELLLVGDTLHDAEVAAALGIACILVPGGHQSPERLRTAGVPVAESLATLSV